MTSYRSLDVGEGLRGVMSDGREIRMMQDWTKEEGISLHPGLASSMEYSKQRAQWKVPISHKLDELGLILKSHQEDNSLRSVKDASWSDVVSYIDAAKKTYTQKADDNYLRGWVRDNDVAIGILGRLSSFIPDQKGLSILKTALVFIFQTWQIRLANVSLILQELDNIPGFLASLLQISDTYSGDIALENKIWDFYFILVDSISEFIDILNRTGKDSNVFKKIARQIPEKESERIGQLTKRIHQAKEEIFNATVHLDRNMWQQTKLLAQKSYTTTEAVRQTVHDIKAGVTEFRYESSQGHDRLTSKVNHIAEELAQDQERRKRFEENMLRAADLIPKSTVELIVNAIYQISADSNLKRRLEPPSLMLFASPHPSYAQITQPCFTEGDILNVLNIPDPVTDAEYIIRQESLMNDEALEYVDLLARKQQFKEWLSSEGSSLLLVDGRCNEEGIGRSSPMSYFIASFAFTLFRSQAGIVLQFFCGHHADPQKQDSGPKGLLRSLISQILLYPKPYYHDLRFINQTLFEAVADGSTEALCSLFETLFRQIEPSTTFYILVDGVSYFESDLHGYGERMDRVLILFRTLINMRYVSGPALKVLMTSPNRSSRLAHQVHHEEIVRLSTEGVGDTLRVRGRSSRVARTGRSPRRFTP